MSYVLCLKCKSLYSIVKWRLHCKEISIYVFPEKELGGLSPNFHIHVTVSVNTFHDQSTYFVQQNRQTDHGNT
jgi:hypothetical protein